MASPRATAVFLLAALIVYAAVYPDTHLPLLALLTLGWGIATLHLCTPAKAPSEARLEKALQSVHKPPGLSDAWWEQQWSQIASLRMVAYLVVLGAIWLVFGPIWLLFSAIFCYLIAISCYFVLFHVARYYFCNI